MLGLLVAPTNRRGTDVQAVNNRVHIDMRDLSPHILYQQFRSIQDRTTTIEEPAPFLLQRLLFSSACPSPAPVIL